MGENINRSPACFFDRFSHFHSDILTIGRFHAAANGPTQISGVSLMFMILMIRLESDIVG